MTENASIWDRFYAQYGVKFYKDRHWLRREVSELMPAGVRANPRKWCPPLEADGASNGRARDEPPTIDELRDRVVGLEAGCGCGSAAFPLVRANEELFVFACDCSKTAIELMKRRDEYRAQLASKRRRVYAWVGDLANDEDWAWLEGTASDIGGLHFVTLIYVLSALTPDQMRGAVARLARLLRPGGMLFFRDYAAGDMKQDRFDQRGTKNKAMFDKTYKRGEGTLAHYFTAAEVRALFLENDGLLAPLQLVNVQRDIANRKMDITMNRIWIQGKFIRKSPDGSVPDQVLPALFPDDPILDAGRGPEQWCCGGGCWGLSGAAGFFDRFFSTTTRRDHGKSTTTPLLLQDNSRHAPAGDLHQQQGASYSSSDVADVIKRQQKQ